jgi:hypothetical protein
MPIIDIYISTCKKNTSNVKLPDIPSKEFRIKGTNILKQNNIGSGTIQQKVTSWSYLIIGKLALTQEFGRNNIFRPKDFT